MVENHSYVYQPGGQLVGVHDAERGETAFTLDAAGHVTAVQGTRWSERYAYDEAGNPTDATWPNTLPGHDARGTRTFEGSRVIRAGTYSSTYDAPGPGQQPIIANDGYWRTFLPLVPR
ncbi:hypothetical protein [Streptomyces hoynatensis]|uniref:RHS repeat protein n=1 Tax=Streptomyces hoynatensis TaxID=1141874 RepID=A0A3A9YVN2_9ACTN|nr:hypothetical protein [Streptomyces hoynatensis]RKN39266.1 hypothetical protein D7294_22115 [Streptomyces hoynatensis]